MTDESLDDIELEAITEEEKQSENQFEGLLNRLEGTESSQEDLDELLARAAGSEITTDEVPSDQEDTDAAIEETAVDDAIDIEALEDASEILVKGPGEGLTEQNVCPTLLGARGQAGRNVLLVSLNKSAEERIDIFDAHCDQPPTNLAIVTASDSVRSKTTSQTSADSQTDISIDAVPDPGDLTKLGIIISKSLTAWQGNQHETVVCFHSLTTLLQYTQLQRLFRFIHVLQGRLDNVNAFTHYHIDSEAHEPQTYATLKPLFDKTIEIADSNVTIE